MKDIYLYGHLADVFGPHHRYEVNSVQEAMWALDTNHDGKFFQEIRKDQLYQIVRGPDLDADQLDEKQLVMKFSGMDSFHICPVIEGSGGGSGKGIAMAVIGVALIATGVGIGLAGMGAAGSFGAAMGAAVPGTFGLMTYTGLTLFGAALALSGVSQLLSPSTSASDYDSREAAKDRKSSLFNGPVNTIEQGGCIPVVFGRHWIGTTVVSAGLTVTEDPPD